MTGIRWIVKIGFGGDCITPTWPSRLTKQVHDWRTYVTPELRLKWDTFTEDQRILLAQAFEQIAQNEQWD